MTTGIVTRRDDYRILEERLHIAFQSMHRLPDQVFARGFSGFRFLEFHVMLSERFWNLLSACATRGGDTDVGVVILDPEPEAYYYANFNRYGALRLRREASSSEYSSALWAEPEGSPADALIHNSSVITWCGSSTTWAFWGERQWGIGVAAARSADMSWPMVEGIEWFDIDDALSDLVAMSFPKQEVPRELADSLRRSFRPSGGE